jgi:hypothetical protein
MSGVSGAVQPRARLIYAGSLYAEYSIAQASLTGRWFAIGSVRDGRSSHVPPAWILAGTGDSPDEAIRDLQSRLEHEQERLASMDVHLAGRC